LPNLSLKSLEIILDLNCSDIAHEKVLYLKLITNADQKSKYCFIVVNCRSEDEKVLGYTLIENPTKYTFKDSIFDPEIQSCVIYCKSMETCTVTYFEAEHGLQKQIKLIPV
jgi:hypothetical protein